MNKLDFLNELERRLSGISELERNKTLSYFSEIISDKIEDGMTEEEAVASLGSIDEIVRQEYMDAPMAQVIKAKMNEKKSIPVWAIVLIIVCIPFWVPIAIAFLSIILAIYISVWAVIFSLWAATAGIVIGGIGSAVSSFFFFGSSAASGIFALGTGLSLIGAGILLIYPVLQLSKLLVKFTGWFAKKIKGLVVGKKAIQ